MFQIFLLIHYKLQLRKPHNPRFVGMKNGIFRIYPGQVMAKTYDHTQRPWYKAAEARPNTDVFTTPYMDVLQGGAVLTMSRTIFEKKLVDKGIFVFLQLL